MSEKTPDDVFKLARDENIKYVDVRFCDLPGTMQHFTIPIYAFDGSSIRGFQSIHESDMLLLPDPETATIDPFRAAKTLNLNFFVHDPFTLEVYSRDPRNVARKAENYLISSGIADTAYFGPEAEFYIFDSVSFDSRTNGSFYEVDAISGWWNTGEPNENDGSPNRGYKVRPKGGYFPVAPVDHYVDLRGRMLHNLIANGFSLEKGHHEVGSGGQAEINYKFNTLLHAADDMQLYKYIVKNTAWQAGKTVTFMPKPLFQDNGSGMHTHQSLWAGGKPLFAGDGYAGLSQLALWYIGGLIKHGPALSAIIAPTTNSYKRLVPGFEAPVNLAYSRRNRSAACRIPMYSASPKAKRVEFRPPDPSCNPYLAFSAMLMAGLDGVENKIDPGQPLDKDIYDLGPEELAKVPSMPGSLDSALEALGKDQQFLLKGDVFTEEMLNTYIEYKREKEVNAMRLRPHPYEFQMYYDI